MKTYVVAKGEDSLNFLISSEIIPKPSGISLKTWVTLQHKSARLGESKCGEVVHDPSRVNPIVPISVMRLSAS